MRSSVRLAIATLFVAASSAAAQAPGAAAAPAGPVGPVGPAAPAAGEMAPDFTAPWADASGTRSAPVSLKSLRGKVVVLAFYPLDRSGGCTIELSKFRDDYATLFGENVVVLPVSVDSLESHTSWAKDAKFPFSMISDTKGELATKYGSTRPGAKYFSRTIFVIGKDGRISYEQLKFNVQSQDAWDQLAQEIKKAKAS